MQEKRSYEVQDNFVLSDLGTMLEQYLSWSKSLCTQRFDMDDKIILQCLGSDSQWKKFIGLDMAVTVELQLSNHVLTVTVGNAKWIDKLGVATIGAIWFSPLVLTAGIGALRQVTLPKEIFSFIENKLLHRVRNYDFLKKPVCPVCGNLVHETDAFCTKCGTKLS